MLLRAGGGGGKKLHVAIYTPTAWYLDGQPLPNSSFTWPLNVFTAWATYCGGGCGGGGGHTVAGGGGGGGGGASNTIHALPLIRIPSGPGLIGITVGIGGAGGAAGLNGLPGSRTILTGDLFYNPPIGRPNLGIGVSGGTGKFGTLNAGGQGGYGAPINAFGLSGGAGGAGGTAGVNATTGGPGIWRGPHVYTGGGGGGGGGPAPSLGAWGGTDDRHGDNDYTGGSAGGIGGAGGGSSLGGFAFGGDPLDGVLNGPGFRPDIDAGFTGGYGAGGGGGACLFAGAKGGDGVCFIWYYS